MLTDNEKEYFGKTLDAVRTKVELFKDNGVTKKEMELSSPSEIYDYLDRFVVGQERAKKILSVVAHNHYKRLLIWRDSGFKKKLDKTNCILIGPTGSGKTFMVKQLADYLKVPCFVADANSLTAAGYVGKDAESIVEGLINVSNENYDAAATGIIFIDEFDKIAKRKGGGQKQKDVGGESVQQALLKIIEGTVMEFERNTGLAKVKFSIDTSNILVIVGGAFVGLEEIIEKRMNIKRSTPIGFTGSEQIEVPDKDEILKYAKSEDLEEFGFIPEILGRLPLVATLKRLSVNDLKNILSKVENNLIEQYTELFNFSEKELVIDDEAIEQMAIVAETLGTGARSLKTIMENVLLDPMFEVEHTYVTKEDVEKIQSQVGYNPEAKTNKL